MHMMEPADDRRPASLMLSAAVLCLLTFLSQANSLTAHFVGDDFDFEHIQTLVLSAGRPGSGVALLLDDIRLESVASDQ